MEFMQLIFDNWWKVIILVLIIGAVVEDIVKAGNKE